MTLPASLTAAGIPLAVFVVANALIVAGYVFIGVMVVPNATARLARTRVGGIFFFLLCASTHADMAYRAFADPAEGAHATSPIMLTTHVAQALAVWAFVTGLYIETTRWGPWAAGATRRPTPS